MNRSGKIVSYLSLDGIRRAGEYAAMLTQLYQLYVERTDKARKMARFYAMAIEPSLFGEDAAIQAGLRQDRSARPDEGPAFCQRARCSCGLPRSSPTKAKPRIPGRPFDSPSLKVGEVC